MKIKRRVRSSEKPLAWRADFRDVELLPDTKAVRTGFLVNFVAIALFTALLVKGAFNEYVLHTVVKASGQVEQELERDSGKNRAILYEGGEFNRLRRRAEEVASFMETSVSVPTFLSLLGKEVPAAISLLRLELEQLPSADDAPESGYLVLQGFVRTEATVGPSALLEDFQEAVSVLLGGSGQSIESDLESFGRNSVTGDFDFVIRFRIIEVEEEAQ